MKKGLKLFLILITFFITTKVYASSLNITLNGNNTFNKEIILNLQVNNLVDFNGSCKGLCGFVGTLDYNKSKIELVSISALNGFDLVQGNKIVLYKATGVNNKSNILKLKFKNKKLKNNETTVITFKNITVSDGDKDIETKNVSKTIKFKKVSNNKPTNSVSKSNNNYLANISLDNGNIKFSKDILNYDIAVKNDIKDIVVTAVADDKNAKIEGNGKFALNVGNNVLRIKVIAEDGSEKTYTLNIKREKDDINVNESNNNVIVDNNELEEKNNTKYYIIIGISLLVIVSIILFIIKRKKDSNV